MQKTSIITTLIGMLVVLVSIQTVFLFNLNGKFEKFEKKQAVLVENSVINKNLIKNIDSNFDKVNAEIHNFEVILSRSMGKYIELVIPPDFTNAIDGISAKLEQTEKMEDLTEIEDAFNMLIQETPKWIIDDQFKKLGIISDKIKMKHLLFQAESEPSEDNIDSLIEGFEDSQAAMNDFEVVHYHEKIKELAISYAKKREQETNESLKTLTAKALELLNDVDSTTSDLLEILPQLEKYNYNESATDIISTIDKKVKLLNLYSEIERIDNLLDTPPEVASDSKLELFSQCSSEAMSLYDNILQLKDEDLRKNHQGLVETIETKISLEKIEITKEMNQRINDYNSWALSSIVTFNRRVEEIKKDMGWTGDISKEKGLRIIFYNLENYLLKIDQNLLLDSVREVYAKAYNDARSILDDENYTYKIAKASATARREMLKN